MTAGLSEIRQEIARVIGAGVEANVVWYGISQDSGLPLPRISIAPAGDYVDYSPTQGNDANVQLVAVVEVVAQDDETLAMQMDAYLDPVSESSISALLADDPTLGGLVAYAGAATATMSPDNPFRADVTIEVMML